MIYLINVNNTDELKFLNVLKNFNITSNIESVPIDKTTDKNNKILYIYHNI